ncbi:hypothetical protein GF373_07715 [bacterium]|nr:hypothetical protein [bacterium]
MESASQADKFINQNGPSKSHYQYTWLLLIVLFSFAAIVFLPVPMRNTAASLVFIFLIAAQWIYMATHYPRKAKAGKFLMDVGPNKRQGRMYKAVAVLLFLASGWFLIMLLKSGSRLPLQGITIPFLFSLGCFNYFLGKNSWLELRENGVLFMSSFVRWQDIQSMQWSQNRQLYLIATRNHPISSFQQIFKWPVPNSSKEAIDRVLARKFAELNGS